MNHLTRKGIKVTVKNESSAISPFILNTLFFIGMLFLFYWFMGRKMGGSSGPFGMGKSRAKMLNGKEDTRKVTFNNVAGVDEAKEEVQEIVEFLKDFFLLIGKAFLQILVVSCHIAEQFFHFLGVRSAIFLWDDVSVPKLIDDRLH